MPGSPRSWLPRLVSRAGAPAMSLKEICGRGQRVGRDVEISRAVVQDVLGQELCLADFTVHRAPRACREDAAIDQRQRCVKLVGKIGRPTTVVSECSYGRQSVLTPALASECRLHPPNSEEGPWRDAIALLDRCKQRCMGLLECTSACGNGRTAAFGEKLIERQAETSLAAVSCDGRGRIARRSQGREGRSAHAPSSPRR